MTLEGYTVLRISKPSQKQPNQYKQRKKYIALVRSGQGERIKIKEEFQHWRSQFVTSNPDKMGLRYAPMAFTEQGVAVLSSVLRSDRAILVNIQVMRIFTKLRHALLENEEKKLAVEDLRNQTDK